MLHCNNDNGFRSITAEERRFLTFLVDGQRDVVDSLEFNTGVGEHLELHGGQRHTLKA